MKSKFLTVVVMMVIFLAFIPVVTFASGSNCIVTAPPTAAPFDGGLSLLIAAGIGYASKKAYDKRKKVKMQAEMDK